MNIEKLLDVVVKAMEDRKAQDIHVLNVRGICDVADFMIIASGNSSRQVTAIAEYVVEKAKASGKQPLGSEGKTEGEWVLVDLGDIVVHVMLPRVRDFYQLEKLWNKMD
ncbi:MAG: ribosome silencing factor [Gammaproteobacteria bacterium]|nr:ribosome silencing factor [Gammaproteobacteria bacterium]